MQLSLQPVLEDFISAFEAVNLRSLGIFIDFFAVDISYQDPFHSIRGQDSLHEMFLHRIENYDAVRYKVIDFAWGRRDGTVYIVWEVMKSGKFIAEVIMELCIPPDSKVISCKEFWSANHPLDQKTYSRAIF